MADDTLEVYEAIVDVESDVNWRVFFFLVLSILSY